MQKTIPANPNSKPQTAFKSVIRDNHQDNSLDFYTPEDYNSIRSKIETLDPAKMIHTNPSLKLCPFNLGTTSFEYIDTEELLNNMTQKILKTDTEIGLDIEQTNLDSYQGYNCLIQISSSHGNYIIDAIALHDILPLYLRKICENEDIVKVFYGGGSDLLWLNRDYGVFVVNYFDVYQTSTFYDKKMDCSLVGLFKEYCAYIYDKNIKKTFQLADWRIRPLTQDQLTYAALDSHYLVYLRNVLLEKIKKEKDEAKVVAFLKQMQAPCLKTYQLKNFSIEASCAAFTEAFSVYRKEIKAKKQVEEFADSKASHSDMKRTFVTLCKLRDSIARKFDTNPDQVCSTRFLLELCISLNKESSLSDIKATLEKLFELETVNKELFLSHVEDVKEVFSGNGLIEESELNSKDSVNNKEEKMQAKMARKKAIENMAKNKDVYEECKLLAPDGELLCFTNRKKIAWYQAKGIGTLVQEEPPIVRLNFEPSNRGYSDMIEMNIDKKLYEGIQRANHCVICGQKEKLSRYHVVPVLYRHYFPPEMKEHKGHDILLLCERCLDKANKESFKYIDVIAKRYDTPLLSFEKPQAIKSDIETIKKAVMAMEKYSAMPKENQRKLKQDIREMFDRIKGEDLTDDFKEQVKKFRYNSEQNVKLDEGFRKYFKGLKSAKNIMKNCSSNKEFKSVHGKLVLEKLQSPEEFKEFVEGWRLFFIDALDPQFLPYDWHLVMKKRAEEKSAQNKNNT